MKSCRPRKVKDIITISYTNARKVIENVTEINLTACKRMEFGSVQHFVNGAARISASVPHLSGY